MELRDIIAAPKSDIKIGPWHTGKVPRAEFPLARKAYSLGSAFQWCVITMRALEIEVRVLVVVNFGKRKYDAILGIMSATGLHILCCYQYHSGEPGWHCHAACDDVGRVPTGVFRGPWVRRLPHAKRTHRRLDFGITDTEKAIRFAQHAYGIFRKGALL